MRPKFLLRTGASLMLAMMLATCGDEGLSGEYGRTDAGQWFTILTFRSGEQVTLTMIGSPDRINGTYKRSGDSVTLTAAGETRRLRMNANGCLDGGAGNSFFSGVICRKS